MNDPVPTAPPRGSSTLGSLFGLAVIWGCLYLVALAQIRSQQKAQPPPDSGSRSTSTSFGRSNAWVALAEPLANYTDRADNPTSRSVIEGLLRRSGLRIDPAELQKIPQTPENHVIAAQMNESISMGGWISTISRKSGLGFAERNGKGWFFELEGHCFDQWSAQIELSRDETLIYAGCPTRWFSALVIPVPGSPGMFESHLEMGISGVPQHEFRARFIGEINLPINPSNSQDGGSITLKHLSPKDTTNPSEMTFQIKVRHPRI